MFYFRDLFAIRLCWSITPTSSLDTVEIGVSDFTGITFVALSFVVIFFVWDTLFDWKFKHLVQDSFEDQKINNGDLGNVLSEDLLLFTKGWNCFETTCCYFSHILCSLIILSLNLTL